MALFLARSALSHEGRVVSAERMDRLDGIRQKTPHEVLVFDAGYGEIRPFLAELDKRKELFIGQIPESHSFGR